MSARRNQSVVCGRRHRSVFTVLCLVILMSLAAVLTSPSVAAKESGTTVGTATETVANQTGAPDILTGYYVTFTCYNGTITLDGSQDCTNQSVMLDLCYSGTCSVNLVGAGIGGLQFMSWSQGGYDQSLTCTNQNCSQATLTVVEPKGVNEAGHVYENVMGYVVTFTCTGGTVTHNGTPSCQNQVRSVDLCNSGTCQYSVVGSGIGVNSFRQWTSAGYDQSLQCNNGNCSQATLTVTLPSGTYTARGSLVLTVGHQVSVTISTFVDWATGSSPGDIQICMTTCANYTNGQIATLWTNSTYTLSGANLGTGESVSQWTTNAGSLGNNGEQESVLVTSAGTLDMLIREGGASASGYIYSPATSGTQVTNVSADFNLAYYNYTGKPLSWNMATWVGIGGYTNKSTLWQAGVTYFYWQSNESSKYVAFFEGVPKNGGPHLGPYYDWGMNMRAGDEISVTVTSNISRSTFYILDRSIGKSWSNNSVVFGASLVSAAWSAEPSGLPSPSNLGPTSITFANMVIDGAQATILGGYLVPWMTNLVPGGIALAGSNTYFGIQVD